MKKNLIRGVLLAGLVFALSATSLATRAESALGIRPGTPSISDFSSTPYMAMNGSAPMRWAACGTIDYQLNLREAPRGAAACGAALEGGNPPLLRLGGGHVEGHKGQEAEGHPRGDEDSHLVAEAVDDYAAHGNGADGRRGKAR